MSSPEINSVLAQMRVLSAELKSPPAGAANVAQSGDIGFGVAMKEAIEHVNKQQGAAVNLVNQFETGAGDKSVAEVMVAMQKASVSFEAMTEVRNRLVEAYREIMSMPV